MFNPYYNSEKLNLRLLSFDEKDLFYEYNTLCFWATPDGRIYIAQDSGCSCPTPFEEYEGATQEHVLSKLERVGSVEQAEQTFDAWNDHEVPLPQSERKKLTDWVKANLKA